MYLKSRMESNRSLNSRRRQSYDRDAAAAAAALVVVANRPANMN